jgi:hypothetical protein
MAQNMPPSAFLRYLQPKGRTRQLLGTYYELAKTLFLSRVEHMALPKKERGNLAVKQKNLTTFCASTARCLALLYEKYAHCAWLWKLYIGISTAFRLMSAAAATVAVEPIHSAVTEDCVVCREGKSAVYITKCGHCICVECYEGGLSMDSRYWKRKGCPYCKQKFMIDRVIHY